MFENFKAGWRLGRATRKLIMKDKKLFVYPLISGGIGIALFVALLASFLVAVNTSVGVWIVALVAYYILVYFFSTYTIMAMLIAFRSYGKGKEISIREAFSQTRAYWKQILEWAIFEAIVTMIIRAIEQRFGGIAGAIIGVTAGLAMAAATFFAVPVILDKKVGPISAIRESVSFIFHNFGKTFGGMAYADLYIVALGLLGIAVMMAGAGVSTVSGIAGIAVAAVGFVILVFSMLFGYVISNTVRLIIYDYMANQAELPEGWDRSLIEDAVKGRGRRGTPVEPQQAPAA